MLIQPAQQIRPSKPGQARGSTHVNHVVDKTPRFHPAAPDRSFKDGAYSSPKPESKSPLRSEAAQENKVEEVDEGCHRKFARSSAEGKSPCAPCDPRRLRIPSLASGSPRSRETPFQDSARPGQAGGCTWTGLIALVYDDSGARSRWRSRLAGGRLGDVSASDEKSAGWDDAASLFSDLYLWPASASFPWKPRVPAGPARITRLADGCLNGGWCATPLLDEVKAVALGRSGRACVSGEDRHGRRSNSMSVIAHVTCANATKAVHARTANSERALRRSHSAPRTVLGGSEFVLLQAQSMLGLGGGGATHAGLGTGESEQERALWEGTATARDDPERGTRRGGRKDAGEGPAGWRTVPAGLRAVRAARRASRAPAGLPAGDGAGVGSEGRNGDGIWKYK
ncbi:hypothetical protein WOLCODRAFT_148595 [Wolfiporia cocos MD-104 SS10]|uniref:Uncharacterized protein n=1 Tax=Wolfiporia cocos (strain MD-104) TaxID=742152 RepID=A0A2H3JNQ8_WOLCO|nr:hypothetical protein WOLCODRAFT_148595 [Wolfiporia cocos MD-104 SS10]